MDERRARIHEDLRGLLDGELWLEPVERAAYAQDASVFEIDPLGVIAPRSVGDLTAVLRYATAQGLSLHPRGAGTSLAGEVLGSGLVIDFSKHFRRLRGIQAERVIVQPGMVLDTLNAQLAPLGRRIGPNPTRSESITIGGMIGGNAAGPRSLRFGAIADHVEELEVLFANGELARIGREFWPTAEESAASMDFKETVTRKLANLFRWHSDLMARQVPSIGRAGYNLQRVAIPEGLHLARLVCGSQGTLALVTEVTLRTVPLPVAQRVLLLPFKRLGDAATAMAHCLQEGPSRCELVDWRSIRLARDASLDWRGWLSTTTEAALIVEFEGDDPAPVAGRVRALVRRLSRDTPTIGPVVEAARRSDCERLLSLSRVVEPLVMRLKGTERPIPLVDGLVIPPEALPDYLLRLQNIFKSHEVNWTAHAFAGHGQLQARPFLDLSNPSDRAKVAPLATEIFEAALDLGGTVSGEHGRGLISPSLFRKGQGDLLPVFREIKNIFDPEGLLNPGKVTGADPQSIPWPLRSQIFSKPESFHSGLQPALESRSDSSTGSGGLITLSGHLKWIDRGPLEHAAACNGCGACRSLEPSLRMCPIFRASRAEGSSPRAKAGLFRQLASGLVDPKHWGTEAVKQAADQCVHCHLCAPECPAGVDVSGLMLEAKAAYVEVHGLSPTDWVLSRVEFWARLGSRFPVLLNALMSGGKTRWMIERLFGVSRYRILPKARRTPFVRRADRLGLTRPRPQEPGPRVAYFVDIVPNYFDQELAEMVVNVLRYCGVNVFVPKGQRGCGMPALVAGDLDTARDQAITNLRILGDAVRDGYTIVCSEPTATLMLRQEYLKLTDDLDAGLLAANTMDLGQYLAGLQARGLLPRPRIPLRGKVGYHQPCHQRALAIGTPGLDLLHMIPELEVEFIDRGCSGIAGTFGMARQNFRPSLRAGRGLRSRLRDPDIEIGSTECGTCRMQMEQGITKRTFHPIKLLGLAYGLDPSLRLGFREPKPRHQVY